MNIRPQAFEGSVLVCEPSTHTGLKAVVYRGPATLAVGAQAITLLGATSAKEQFVRQWPLLDVKDVVHRGSELRFKVVSGAPQGSGGTFECTFTGDDEASVSDLREQLVRAPNCVPHSGSSAAAFARRLVGGRDGSPITNLVIAANVVVFIIMILSGVSPMSPSGKELVGWGANVGVLTTSGEWWRMLTCCFVHIGVLHLAFNMYALSASGHLVERLFGSGFYLAIYLGSGLGGSLTSLWWNPETISAGASGSIFGVYGALLGCLLSQRGAVPTGVVEDLWKGTLVFVGYNLLLGFRGGIDQAAHVGGLLTGGLCGLVAARPLDLLERKAMTFGSAVRLALSLALVLGLGFAAVPHLGPLGLTKRMAEKGNPRAEYLVALAYEQGKDVQQDSDQALKWLYKSAEHGFAPAQLTLGIRYLNGEGVRRNATEAANWFTQAAKQGLPEAQFDLGLIYSSGQGVKRDPTMAFEWMFKAAEQGFAPAQCNVGVCYAKGDGCRKDQDEALNWYRKSAEQNCAQAQLLLGYQIYTGEGVEKDFALAAQWYRQAAEQGNSLAQCLLGQMYAKGEGVPKSRIEAASWFRKGAEGTNASALNGAAWFLATCTDAEVRDGPAAVAFAERAVAATHRKDPNYLDTLAAAHAEAGQFEKAIAFQKEALSGISRDRKGELTDRLKLYEAGRPYHEQGPETATATNQTQVSRQP